MPRTTSADIRRSWRNQIVYNDTEFSNKIRMPWHVYEYLVSDKLIGSATMRIGESIGNCLICGIGVDYLTLNVHPSSVTKRFTLTL